MCASAQPAGTATLAQPDGDAQFHPAALDATIPFFTRGENTLRLTGGFSGTDGSFAALTDSVRNLLHLGETLHLSAETAVRERRIEFGLTEPSLRGTKIQYGFNIYAQRFHYNQEQSSSITAFERTSSLYKTFDPTDLIDYRMSGYGVKLFAQLPVSTFGRINVAYTYDISAIRPVTDGTLAYFDEYRFQASGASGGLTGIRTSSLSPSYSWNTVDNLVQPTRGALFRISATIAGLGGTVNMIEPDIEAKYYHSGLWKRHVIALHVHGRMLSGYGGKSAPPYYRFYMGGEDDVRGFDSWTAGPVGFVPAERTFPVLNANGTQQTQKTLVDGVIMSTEVTVEVPAYRVLGIGGDTNVVSNVEYRVPLFGPVTLALFNDAALDRISFERQLRLNNGNLNAEFPGTFSDLALVASGTQGSRMSTGPELQVFLPKLHVPLRLFWAYNPLGSLSARYYNPPIVINPSVLHSAATVTYVINALSYGDAAPVEPTSRFGFAIGRTF